MSLEGSDEPAPPVGDAASELPTSGQGLSCSGPDRSAWLKAALRGAGRGSQVGLLLRTLADRADCDGLVRPDPEVIGATFARLDDGGVRDLRSGSISHPRLMFVDTELWLSAATGLDLLEVEEILGRLQFGDARVSLIEAVGDPRRGLAELILRDPCDSHPVDRAVREGAQCRDDPPLPVLGDRPSISLEGTGWSRGSGEYKRPAGSVALVSIDEARRTSVHDHSDLNDRLVFWMSIRGLDYHQRALPRPSSGRLIWLELVPEPSNPFDRNAVALDFNGVRVGYVGAGVAYRAHQVVRYQNLDGNACFVPGVINGDHGHVALPTQARLEMYIDRRRVASEMADLWAALPSAVRQELTENGFELGQGHLKCLASIREIAPHVGLSAEPRADCLPFVLQEFLHEKRQKQREERRQVHIRVRAQAAERSELRKAGRDFRNRQIVELHHAGRSNAAIVAEVGVSSDTVRRVLKDAGIRPSVGLSSYAEALLRSRAERCLEAISLQRAGLSRSEIALALGVSVDTAKVLVRDGRFFEFPENNPTRLDLAISAHLHAWSKAALDHENPEMRRAVTDARVLELLKPELLER